MLWHSVEEDSSAGSEEPMMNYNLPIEETRSRPKGPANWLGRIE
jgi:hypothetical protein